MWWSGLTKRDASLGMSSIGAAREAIDGFEYWSLPGNSGGTGFVFVRAPRPVLRHRRRTERLADGMDIRAHRAYKCQMKKHLDEPLPSTRTRSTAIGASAIGAQATKAQAIGGLAIGALAVGAVAIGAFAIGRLVIGRLTIRRTRLGVLEIDDLRVGRLHVRELVVDDKR